MTVLFFLQFLVLFALILSYFVVNAVVTVGILGVVTMRVVWVGRDISHCVCCRYDYHIADRIVNLSKQCVYFASNAESLAAITQVKRYAPPPPCIATTPSYEVYPIGICAKSNPWVLAFLHVLMCPGSCVCLECPAHVRI
jgi:hypothetical protein